MLAEQNRAIDESYLGAVSTSDLRLREEKENHTTAADMVAAAGMNRHRMGLSLLRLASEWNSAARPIRATHDDVTRLADTYHVEPAFLGWNHRNPNAGKVLVPRAGREPEYVLPRRLAQRERSAWYEHEARLVLMALRSLPAVRAAMLAKAQAESWACDEHVVAAVILWWLAPKCPSCGGNKEDVVAGTGRTNGRICTACKGTGMERQGEPPHGRKGMLLWGYMNGCLNAARRELGEGFKRARRTMAGESSRQGAKD